MPLIKEAGTKCRLSSRPQLECWFEFASTYSYVGVMRAPDAAAKADVELVWKLCAKHGLPFKRPSVFPRNSVLASRVAIVGASQPWAADFIRSVFRANFAEDQEISDLGVLAALLERCGVVPEPVLEKARSDDVKAKLRAQTDEAAKLGIFGAPNFVVNDELFFGQDRLDDAIAWVLR